MTKEQIIQNIKTRISTIESYHPEEYVLNKGILLELKDLLSMIEKDEPSLSSNLDEAAKKYLKQYNESEFGNGGDDWDDDILITFKAGATWRENQMKMPSSSELIAAWDEVKSVLREKDFRGDEWRLAYNAFMFGFSNGLNTKIEK